MVFSHVVRKSSPHESTAVNAQLRASAHALVRQLLAMTDLDLSHRRHMLGIALWKLTEADGVPPHPKYNVRYCSRGVIEDVAGTSLVNHEHVFPKKLIIARLLAGVPDSELDVFLDERSAACIVTTDEHAMLTAATGDGWDRYRQTGIDVFDRQTMSYRELGVEASESRAVAQPADQTRVGEALDTVIVEFAEPGARAGIEAVRNVLDAIGAVGLLQRHSGEVPAYFRIHDATLPDPTPAAAYMNLNGNLDLRLSSDDLPAGIERDISLLAPAKTYRVRCDLREEARLATALRLLGLSLQKVRDQAEG